MYNASFNEWFEAKNGYYKSKYFYLNYNIKVQISTKITRVIYLMKESILFKDYH